MRELKLPKTIRLAQIDEVPKNSGASIRLEKAKNNRIVEGYTINEKPIESESSYTFYSEININNDRLWHLFKTLMMSMPKELSLISAYKDDEVSDAVHSAYLDKYELFNKIEPYETELTSDGFIKFGVIFNTSDYLEEIFVTCSKYIQYWGVDKERFVGIMHDFSLYETPEMEFIDEYPMVTKALFTLDANVLQTEELILKLREI